MANNKLSLKLEGTVPLDLYNTAVINFTALVAGLTEEIIGENGVQWTVTDLRPGSAFVEVTGYAIEEAERVALGYRVVGTALLTGQMIPYSTAIEEAAIGITSILNGKITGVSFGDANETIGTVTKPIQLEQQRKFDKRDYGVVEGSIHSVTDTPTLRLGLYDDVMDKRIYVYLSADRSEEAREVWLKRIRVSGMIKRDPETGRAIDVRDVSHIELSDDKVEGGFLRARGVLHWQSGDELPEVTIRRLRDGS